MTQLLPEVYRYVKWWGGGTILRAEPRGKEKSGNTRVASKGATPVFPAFPLFSVPQLSPLPGFDGMTIFHERGTKNTGYAWLIPRYGLVTRPHGRLYNQC